MIETRTIRGLRTGWIEEGVRRGPLLFFIHGVPDTPMTWQRQLEKFGDRFNVVAPFGRGVGPSERATDPARSSLDSFALDHLGVLAAVDPSSKRPVVIVGHDFGGAHAWKLAPYLGRRLAGIVTINGPSVGQLWRMLRRPRQLAKSWYIWFFQLPWLPELASKPLARGGLAAAARMGRENEDGDLRPYIEWYRQALRAFPREWTPEPIEAPALAIWSTRDAYLDVPAREMLLAEAPNAELRVLEGEHWLHRQQADRVNELIERFVERALAQLDERALAGTAA